MARTLFLLRHAQSEANATHIYPHDDSPLTVQGVAQANAASAFIRTLSLDAIVVSPLIRARDTALILGIQGQTIPELRDRALGAYIGKPYGEAYAAGAAHGAIDTFLPAGGESYAQARERVGRAYTKLPAGNVLVIAHADTLHWLVELEVGVSFAHGQLFENCALWVIENGVVTHKNWRPWLLPY